MKSFLKFLLGLFVAVCIIFDGLLIWHRATPVRSFDVPSVELNGVTSQPVSGYWRTETLLGYFHKDTEISLGELCDAGVSDSATVSLKTPSRAKCRVVVTKDDEPLFDSTDEIYETYVHPENGDYKMELSLYFAPTESSDELKLTYGFEYSIDVEPIVSFSQEEALQGDIVTVVADMGLSGSEPAIETELGSCTFIPTGEYEYTAYVPVGFAQTPGNYEIKVSAGRKKEVGMLKVSEAEYPTQHMTISKETIAATTGAPNAAEDYAEKIKSTYDVFDNIKYWEKPFIRPVDGRISTQFGLYRYTNRSKTPTRHTGIDIAADEGVGIRASNAGRVVFAGDVIITGYSVVLEHGGGLKTYYYHLSELGCETGEIVEQGDIIGKVGSTGYSTGAHLHFEVKLGEYPLSPWPLFDGSSSVYGFEH